MRINNVDPTNLDACSESVPASPFLQEINGEVVELFLREETFPPQELLTYDLWGSEVSSSEPESVTSSENTASSFGTPLKYYEFNTYSILELPDDWKQLAQNKTGMSMRDPTASRTLSGRPGQSVSALSSAKPR